MPTDPTADRSRENAASALLVYGAGGHGRVVADAAQRSGAWACVRASDGDATRCHGQLLPGVALVPLADAPQDALHVAIGHNAAREREAVALGVGRLATVQHPDATVSPHATVAPGCLLAARAVVGPGARLDLGVIVNHGAVVDHDVQVGAFSHVAPGAVLGGGVRLGTRVLVGAGAVVLPEVSVCDGAVIGAGAVVCRDVNESGTWVGTPARRVT